MTCSYPTGVFPCATGLGLIRVIRDFTLGRWWFKPEAAKEGRRERGVARRTSRSRLKAAIAAWNSVCLEGVPRDYREGGT